MINRKTALVEFLFEKKKLEKLEWELIFNENEIWRLLRFCIKTSLKWMKMNLSFFLDEDGEYNNI